MLLFFAILPVAIILTIVYLKDKEKEPTKLLIEFFSLGVFAGILVLALDIIIAIFFPGLEYNIENVNLLSTAFEAFIGIALVEEVFKWIMVYFKGYKHQEFNETYDIIIYSVFVSLGFACLENILYIYESQTLSTAILRAILAVPGHGCDAIFMGYYLSLAKEYYHQKENQKEKKYVYYSLIVPIVLHGIYDFCLMSGNMYLILLFIVFIIILYTLSIKKLKKSAKANRNLEYQKKYCSICGTKIRGDYCENCGQSHNA